MDVTFEELMQGFGTVTVMNACIFLPKKSYTNAKNCKTAGQKNSGGLSENDFVPAYEYIDTLKIANLTQEGPTKTITGGQYSNPLIKYGKTMTAEIQDALGRASTLVRFFGANYNGYEQYIVDNSDLQKLYLKESEDKDLYGIKIELSKFKTDDKPLIRFNGKTVTNYVEVTDTDTKKTELLIPFVEIIKETTEEGGTPTISELKSTGLIKLGDENGSITGTDYKSLDYSAAMNAIVTMTKPGSRLSITDKFPGPFAIEGDTFLIDQKTGEKKQVFILIPQFVPDAILTWTQDAEGDATVFDLNGGLSVTDIQDEEGTRSIFYEIREDSFFKNLRENMDC